MRSCSILSSLMQGIIFSEYLSSVLLVHVHLPPSYPWPNGPRHREPPLSLSHGFGEPSLSLLVRVLVLCLYPCWIHIMIHFWDLGLCACATCRTTSGPEPGPTVPRRLIKKNASYTDSFANPPSKRYLHPTPKIIILFFFSSYFIK